MQIIVNHSDSPANLRLALTVINQFIADADQAPANLPITQVQLPPGITAVAPVVSPDTSASAVIPSVDSEGLPWDERIHSGGKTITAKGVWARRKNIDDALYDSVRAQLRGIPVVAPVADLPTAPVVPAASAPDLAGQYVMGPGGTPVLAAPVAQPAQFPGAGIGAPSMPGMPTPQPMQMPGAAAPVASVVTVDFPTLCVLANEQVAKFGFDAVNLVANRNGLATMAMAASATPAVMAAFYADMKSMI